MPDVWVKDKKTKVQHALPEALVTDDFEVLADEPVTNLDGSPRQAVFPKSSKSGDAATSGQSAATTKEK